MFALVCQQAQFLEDRCKVGKWQQDYINNHEHRGDHDSDGHEHRLREQVVHANQFLLILDVDVEWDHQDGEYIERWGDNDETPVTRIIFVDGDASNHSIVVNAETHIVKLAICVSLDGDHEVEQDDVVNDDGYADKALSKDLSER